MKKKLSLILAVMLVLTMLASCGGKTSYRSIADIKKSGELVMLTNAYFEPYEYIAGGKVVGADVDLATMIAAELGVELRIIDQDFDGLVDALKNGKGDLIAAGMTNTEERALVVDFSIEYVLNGLLIIVPAGSDIKSAEDLAGKRVAVQEGTTADTYVTDEVAGAEVMRFKDAVVAGTSVSDGRADACVLDIKPAEGVVANSKGALVLLPERLTDESMSMAVGKGNTELLEIVNKVLQQAKDSGMVDALVDLHMEATTNG